MIYAGLVANGDMSALQFRAVRMTGIDFQIAEITNGNSQVPIGILQDAPKAAGMPAEVCGPGEQCKAELGGSVNAGNFLAPDNDGKLINAPQEAAPGTADLYVIAMALQDGADSEIIQVMVVSPYEVSTE